MHVAPSLLTLHDISDDGQVLLTQGHVRAEVFGISDGETEERDFTWFDGTTCPILSADGRNIVFTESLEAGGSQMSVYIRRTDGSPVIRLGDGMAMDLSPDGDRIVILGNELDKPPRIFVQDITGGDPTPITPEGRNSLYSLDFSNPRRGFLHLRLLPLLIGSLSGGRSEMANTIPSS